MSNGFNPMRYDCEKQGCFNKKRRPKIEQFVDCLPGKIAFTDIDAACEINGHQLWLEFKTFEGDLNRGQHLLFINQTSVQTGKENAVFVCVGNAQSMEIQSVAVYCRGEYTDFFACDLNKLRGMIKAWADKAFDISWQCS